MYSALFGGLLFAARATLLASTVAVHAEVGYTLLRTRNNTKTYRHVRASEHVTAHHHSTAILYSITTHSSILGTL